jgi:hypothetical protein
VIERVPAGVVEPAFTSVFAGFDQTGEPFTDTVERGLLIYPTGPYGLDREQLAALAAAGDGDGDAFLSTAPPGDPEAEHFALRPLESYADAELDATRFSPHAIYSPRGIWGVFCTLEEEAYAGGSKAFASALTAQLPRTPEQMAADWLAALAAVQHTYPERRLGAWARRQLTHLYGREAAERLTRDSPLAPAP